MKQAKEFFLRRIAVVLAVLMVVVMLPIGTPAAASEGIPKREELTLATIAPEQKTEMVPQKITLAMTAIAPEREVAKPMGTTADGLEYQVYSDHVEITYYTGSAAEVVIPAEIEGLPVTNIGRSAFYECDNLTAVTLPDSVTNIGDFAFSNCENLKKVTLPSNLDSIGDYAFRHCKSVTSIDIPSGVTYIGEVAFAWCNNLTSITIPESVYSIGELAFGGCSSLTSITLPSGLTSIGDSTFSDCSSLSNIKLPSGIRSVGSWVFSDCDSLESIVLPSSLTSIGEFAFYGSEVLTSIEIPNGVTRIEESTFDGCYSLEYVTIPANVTYIGEEAFRGCSKLKSITIPSGVTIIGEAAFSGCGSLTSISIPSEVTRIEPSTFSGCSSLTDISIHNGVTRIGSYAFYRCTSLTSFTIPAGVTSIEPYTFEDCSSLSNIVIPHGVTSIGKLAFYGCGNLTSISIPNAVTNIGYGAFWNCRSLTAIAIPSGVTEIAYYTFLNCNSLTSITIPSSVTSVGSEAFWGCSSLKSIAIPNGVTCINGGTFNGCSSLTSVTIPSSVTSIEAEAFYGCSSLDNIMLPDALTDIGRHAFFGCSSLKSIMIPSNVSTIRTFAFSKCSSLKSIEVDANNNNYCSKNGILYNKEVSELISCPAGKQGQIEIPSTIKVIMNGAFSGCCYLTDIMLPDGLTTIGESCFADCTGLTTLAIPSSVTDIDWYAFSGCSNLSSINIPNSVTSIGAGAFADCSSLGTITIPEGVERINWETFFGCRSLSEITIPESVTRITYESFVGCDSLSDVYYGGSKSGWEAISIGYSNEDLTNANIHYAKADAHDTIDQLTEEDYMLFSILAYRDLSGMLGDPTADPVKEPKTIGEYYAAKWDKVIPASDGDLGHLKATYEQVFGGIANWFPAAVRKESNGFGATIFGNESGDYVIAYCGSLPPNKWFDNLENWENKHNDWFVNDLPMELFDIAGPQVSTAIGLYESVSSAIDREKIAVTGHSLGGGLGNIVSAYSGCKGVTFNAITCLDTAYDTMPGWMGWEFDGVDKWNFVDHVNENDALAGKFEVYGDIVPLKPYVEHDNRFGTWDLGANHGMGSYITAGNDGYPELTAEVGEYRPNNVLTHMLRGSILKLYVELGTSRNDTLKKGLNTYAPIRAYGGDGADKIYTSSRADYLIGGRGDDVLDGSYGDDNYLYYKGDGLDFVYDISGDDVLYLYGFSDSDIISAVENPKSEFIEISCNGQVIVRISKNNREYSGLISGDSFKVKVTINGKQETINLTELFNTHKAGYRLIVGCPVSVEVLDPNGNVVYTLTDGEVGSWYTEYGNFYVFEEENGEYGKVLDLVEGYTARIVGAGEGTMDVTYQAPVDGELTDPVSVSGVPVTEHLSATIEETEDGDVYLVIDEDSDGETDSERKLYGECPFTDVPEGSFYYESVMWAVEEGITSGATETTFNPNGTCLRAQVVTFLHRADGNPEPTSTRNPFTDVKPGDFFYKPVLWAVEKGITSGVSATAFGSYSNCNRAAVVTFLWRAAGSPEPEITSNPFVDVKATDFFYKPVLWAVENGITAGIDATHFGPTADCNRAQVVTFLYRAFN